METRRRGSPRMWGAVIAAVAGAILALAMSIGVATASSTWTIVSSPNATTTDRNELLGVSCVSTTFCMAVGDYGTGERAGPAGPITQTLVEMWNGSVWTIVASPNPSTGDPSVLNSVSCLAATSCMAVGSSTSAASPYEVDGLAEEWNGSTWTIVPVLPSPKHSSTSLTGVSCTKSTFCMAVGNSGPDAGVVSAVSTVAEQWNGTSWSVASTPDPSPVQADLSKVSCFDAVNGGCLAVGNQAATLGGTTQTLSELWQGGTWSVLASPDPSTTHLAELTDVSCTLNFFCMASGVYSTGSDELPLMAEQLSGQWGTLSAESPPGATQSVPVGISCALTGGICAAVGFSSSPTATLVEQFLVPGWGIAPSQNASGGHPSQLTAVSCPTESFCAAVGYSGPVSPAAEPYTTLAEIGPADLPSSSATSTTPSPAPSVPATGVIGAPLGAALLASGVAVAALAWPRRAPRSRPRHIDSGKRRRRV